MAEIGIQSTIPQLAPGGAQPIPVKKPDGGVWPVVQMILAPIASLRVTVVLMTMAIILVFLGTLAQVDQGIWTVVNGYFRTTYTFIPFQVFVPFGQVFFGVPQGVTLPGKFPFPGGFTIGGLLAINLLAAHLVRFKLTWKRSGILILHSGLILLFVSEVLTAEFAEEGMMQIKENGASNFTVDSRTCELAIVNYKDPGNEDVTVIPRNILRKKGKISHPDLPFDVVVHQFLPNSSLVRSEEDRSKLTAIVRSEVSGTEEGVDTPSAVITLLDKETGKELLKEYLTSVHIEPGVDSVENKRYFLATLAGEKQLDVRPYETVKVNGEEYEVTLRFKRTYKPYSVYLHDFRFDRYMGTDKARNFSSEVTVIDPEYPDRRVVIRMNEPLMHRGETLFQANFDKNTEKATVLQVVQDPNKWMPWLSLPYLGCIVVALGMLVHFGITLVTFLQRRAAA